MIQRIAYTTRVLGSFLLLGMFAGMLYGQDPCHDMVSEAEQLRRQRELEYEKNKSLHAKFNAKKNEMRRMALSFPSHYLKPIKIPNAELPKYRDDRGKCRLNGRNWGTVKDLREYKLDSLRMENQILEVRLRNMNSQLGGKGVAVDSKEEVLTYLGKAIKTKTVLAQRAAYAGKSYSFCQIDPVITDLHIRNKGIRSLNHGFKSLDNFARKTRKTLAFAMNAGMYRPNKQPVGLLIYKGKPVANLNRRKGEGNFYMEPNGVFGQMEDGTAFIYTTKAFAAAQLRADQIWLATQSGPIMLLNGRLNPAFTYKSKNLHFRNAVGIRDDGSVVFAISEQRVNFYEFATFLKELNCKNALYLDGTVSRMYLPALNKYQDLDDSNHLGPILYIFE